MNRPPSVSGNRARVLLLAACLLAASTTGLARGENLGTFSLTCLEIPDHGRGAGLAVVLRTPGGKTFLYDTGSGYPGTGGQAWSGDYNAGRDTVLPYLKSRGIDRIEGVFISHAHYDHFGGLLWLVDHAEIPRLVDSGYTFPGEPDGEIAAYDRLRERFRRTPGAYRAAQAGDRIDLDGRVEVEVLAPPRPYYRANPNRPMKGDTPVHYLPNANSLGLRITHGSVVFLLPGDIQTIDQEELLLPSVPAEKLRCRVLVAPAHGIDASAAFARATHPEVTIASASGRYARWSKTPAVYGAEGSRVFVTGDHGRVTVTSDGRSCEVSAERPGGRPSDGPRPAR